MKLVRKIDSLGRVVIPKDICSQLGINIGDKLQFEIDGNEIVVTKINNHCFFCGGTTNLTALAINGEHVCEKCIHRIKEVL